MTDSTQARIKRLEDENKSRKSAYPIAGSLVPFTIVKSQTFTRTQGGNSIITIRVRFTPTIPGKGGISLILLSPEISTMSDFGNKWPRQTNNTEPQSGDGSVVLNINISTPATAFTYYIRVTASGPSTGVFSIA